LKKDLKNPTFIPLNYKENKEVMIDVMSTLYDDLKEEDQSLFQKTMQALRLSENDLEKASCLLI